MGVMEVVPEINTCGWYKRGSVAFEDVRKRKLEAQREENRNKRWR